MGWLRDFIRRNTKPIPPDRALKANRILSAAYFLVTWNAIAYVIYLAIKKSHPMTEDEEKYPSKYYSRLLGAKDAQVYRFDGTTLVEKYTIQSSEPEKRKTIVDMQKERKAAREREELELLVEGTGIQ